MKGLWRIGLIALTAVSFLAACGEQELAVPAEASDEGVSHVDHDEWESVSFDEGAVSEALEDGRARFAPSEGSFRQVGMLFDGELVDEVQYRVRVTDGEWSEWTALDVTWSEEERHVARILLGDESLDGESSDGKADELEVRNFDGVTRLYLEFYDDLHGDPEVLTRDLPMESQTGGTEDDDVRTAQQGLNPPAMVVSRGAWGARNPGKVCGSAHNAYRMSIHHTASPSNDGGDPAARMRQMQAFHIDSRGWCDIGYHFVVSQSGRVFQGRSSSSRSGAHVGGHNSGNIGISLIGNFDAQVPGDGQLSATASIMRWVHQAHGVALNRHRVKGHREWSGQWTSCPGGHLLARIPELLHRAATGSGGGGSTGGGSISAPPAPKSCGWIRAGEGLVRGRSVKSCDGRLNLVLQGDGNLVLYQAGVGALWSSNTNNGDVLVMQGDGNLVLYTSRALPVWTSHTSGANGASLAIQNDGNVVVYDSSNRPRWNSATKAIWLPPAPKDCGSIKAGEGLIRGRAVKSCDGRFTFVLQQDGNLVLYQAGIGALWSTRTNAGVRLLMQGDGNLVLQNRDGAPIWNTGTHGARGARLVVQDDGNVVIYGSSGAVWNTGTYGR